MNLKKIIPALCLILCCGCASSSTHCQIDGYLGPMEIEVLSEDQRITAIQVLSHADTPEIADPALADFIAQILENQTLQIDAVNGATQSCEALRKGIERLLKRQGFTEEQLYAARPQTPPVQEEASEIYDVVVIGGGGAGLAAAVSAARQGASVAVLEKADSLGGNTIRATAMYNCVDDQLQHPLQIMDSEQLFFEETFNGGHQKAKPELVRILTSQADEGLAFLQELGLEIDTVIDNCLGGEHARGHYSKAHNGTDFIQVLSDACVREQVDFYLNTRAKALIQEGSAVIGVQAVQQRQPIQFQARQGVILATGGFGYNVEMRMQYDQSLTGDLLCSNTPGTVGDGLIMAHAIGASLIDMEYIELYPMADIYDGGLHNSIPNAINHGILVNTEGDRFIREDAGRDELAQAIRAQDHGFVYSLADDDFSSLQEDRDFLEGLVLMGQVVKADTLEDLAYQLELDFKVLEAAVNDYNRSVEQQYDPRFQRRTLINKIDHPPFYATAKTVTVHHTLGGVEINEQAQVLDQKKQLIPRLYAAGEVTGGIHGANRLGGNSFPDCIVFGRIAGTEAAAQPPRPIS
ncbi:flavocytochrome c [Holdemania massiliensis]|uniref:flavocytochrome c n=1 Tax=Holdemania massiliensis TaxID=1468449 RepID=UPI001F05EDB4|nr:flavocytochrome c [Holdemania massiliensis]MCH1942701.1 flavocytochrome c [Holdemania massiliensis]